MALDENKLHDFLGRALVDLGINRVSTHSKPSDYNAGARNVETPNPLGAHVAERHRWHDAWLLGSHIARESYSYPHRIQMFVTEL